MNTNRATESKHTINGEVRFSFKSNFQKKDLTFHEHDELSLNAVSESSACQAVYGEAITSVSPEPVRAELLSSISTSSL